MVKSKGQLKGKGKQRPKPETPKNKNCKKDGVKVEENQPKLSAYFLKKKDEENQEDQAVKVNQRQSLVETSRDEETKPSEGILKTNLHPKESKPAGVQKKTSVKELARMFSKPQAENTVPPPSTVNTRENVPPSTTIFGRLPSKKSTGHKGISCREGSEDT